MSTPKKIFSLLGLLGLLLFQVRSIAQCPSTVATTLDKIALPTPSSGTPACGSAPFIATANNTGTDAYFDGAKECQVMVWDGSSPSFSWDYGGSKGYIAFSTLQPGVTLNDPDVVVQARNGSVFATMVAEIFNGANAGRIYWASFKWGGSSFTLNSSGILGDLANGSCKNPNIDANPCGVVAIVWGQQTNFNITVTTSGGPSGFNFGPIVLNLTRGDIFGAQGYVDGTGCGNAAIGGQIVPLGDRLTSPGTVNHLSEVNFNPDVALSDAVGTCNNPLQIATVAYVNQWFDPATFSVKSNVMARQWIDQSCVFKNGPNATYTMDPGFAGKPRVAARPGSANRSDFQIVMTDAAFQCNPQGPPCKPYNTKIYNWGRHNGVGPSAVASMLSLAPISAFDINTFYNDEAVVTYQNTQYWGTNGDYVVAWTNGGGVANVSGYDIISKTYNQAGTNLAAPGSTRLSIVNNGCAGLSGNQHAPSIAGRYSKGTAFMFHDPGKQYIGYKISNAQPGSSTPLKQAGEITADNNLMQGQTFSAQPNPFFNEVVFNININEGNKAIRIEITNETGRLVKSIQVSSTARSVIWKPDSINGPGTYYARLFTDQGAITTQVVRVK